MPSGGYETELVVDHAGDLLRATGREGLLVLRVFHRAGVQRVPLAAGATYIVGREPPAEIQIEDGSLSRQHARLVTGSAGELTIEDLDSTNGTLVNGVRVEHAEVRLGDQITLGAVTLVPHLSTAAEQEPVALEGHDRFLVRVAEELARARTFRRPFALLMLRATHQSHVSRWASRIAGLREIDRVGLYAEDCVEVLLPETASEAACAFAETVARAIEDVAPAVAVGSYPADATTVGALVERCRRAVCACAGGVQTVASLEGRAAQPGPEVQPVDPGLRRVYEEADRVAESEIPVLILGETGVGKELLARRIHQRSRRRDARFSAVNCGAIPTTLAESTLFGHERGAFTGASERHAGLFESSEGGTVFLDEVGELPLETQAALLRALDQRQIARVGSSHEIDVDVRILAATNRDLGRMVERNEFRQDLFFRLNSVVLEIPPLRRRRQEVAPLVARFIADAARSNGREAPQIEREALTLLGSYSWPGNVRELRNVIERAVVICRDGLITPDDLPPRLREDGGPAVGPAETGSELGFKERVDRFECSLIIDALRACDWNQSEASRRLRLPRRTLVHKMKALGLRKLGYAPGASEEND